MSRAADVSGDLADPGLAGLGRLRIAWADGNMPVLRSIRERFERARPLDGLVVGACLHVTTETANLLKTLQAGGATVMACASNPLSTQDDVAASLVEDEGIATFAVRGRTTIATTAISTTCSMVIRSSHSTTAPTSCHACISFARNSSQRWSAAPKRRRRA